MSTEPELIAIGAIRRPHGVRGEASVDPWSDAPGRFDDLTSVTLVSPDQTTRREVTVESVRWHQQRILVKFHEISSPEDVALIRDWTIEIPITAAMTPAEGEYFIHDLIGMKLFDESGNERGEVVDAYEGGGGVLLEVRHGKRKFDVPFAATICKDVDLPRRRITVELPEGLDEI